jgi:hypothetical protein
MGLFFYYFAASSDWVEIDGADSDSAAFDTGLGAVSALDAETDDG